MSKKTFSIRFFSIQVPIELPQIVSPMRVSQVGVCQEEPLDLQCLTKSYAIYVVDDVSIHLDIPPLDSEPSGSIFHFLLECKLILRRLLVRHSLEVWQ